METTTTNSVSLLQPGIILNKFRTPSGFKPPYLLEQEIEIRSLCQKLSNHLIVDLSRINYSKDKLIQFLDHKIVSKSKSTSVVTSKKRQLLFFFLWVKLQPTYKKVRFFRSKENALEWLQVNIPK